MPLLIEIPCALFSMKVFVCGVGLLVLMDMVSIEVVEVVLQVSPVSLHIGVCLHIGPRIGECLFICCFT